MFSLFKRLVIAVEKIAANSMSKCEYLEFHKELVENQKIKSIEVLNIQLEHSQKELLFRAEYKQSKGIELTVDEQLALERCEREQILPCISKDIAMETTHLLHTAYSKLANGIKLSDIEQLTIANFEKHNK